MILGFELTLFLYIMLAAAFRLMRNWGHRPALALLVIAGSALLILANEVLAFYLFAQIVWVFIVYGSCKLWPKHENGLAWLAFLGLLPLNLNIWMSEFFGSGQTIADAGSPGFLNVAWTAGVSFFVIKSFVALKEALREKQFSILPTLAGLTFLPAFTAGPIFGSLPFRSENTIDRLTPSILIRGFMELGWGAAALYVIAPALREISLKNPKHILGDFVDIYLDFAALFFDFSGYTLMAIGLAAFFGIRLPQNFNRPYLATSIREFWQRWHMSLSWFISTYLFKPFVRKTGSPQKGIFLAFVCVGLWHEVMPGYLLWGIGHGAALSLAMKPPKLWIKCMARLPNWGRKSIGWFLTMTWVALLSRMANASF